MWADTLAMTRQHLLADPTLGLTPGTCSVDVPDPRPDRFVRLVNSGSERRTIVHRDTRITVECWNEGGSASASADAEAVYVALDDWDLVPDFDGWTSSPYAQPDPDTGCPRYVMTCVVRHRMEED